MSEIATKTKSKSKSSSSKSSSSKPKHFIALGTGRRFKETGRSKGVVTLKQVEADVVTGGTGPFGGDHGEIQVPAENLQAESDWRSD